MRDAELPGEPTNEELMEAFDYGMAHNNDALRSWVLLQFLERMTLEERRNMVTRTEKFVDVARRRHTFKIVKGRKEMRHGN